MKILLTLFFLFFSSTVVAGDDLTGKKVLCAKSLLGFDFFSSTKVKMIDGSYPTIDVDEYYYETK